MFILCLKNVSCRGLYERLQKAGKKSMVALTAVMRKMIVILNAMLRNNKKWNFTS